MEYRNINDLDKIYELIMCDPPWKQSRGGKKSVRPNSSGKQLDYPTLSLDEIKEHIKLQQNIQQKTQYCSCGQ